MGHLGEKVWRVITRQPAVRLTWLLIQDKSSCNNQHTFLNIKMKLQVIYLLVYLFNYLRKHSIHFMNGEKRRTFLYWHLLQVEVKRCTLISASIVLIYHVLLQSTNKFTLTYCKQCRKEVCANFIAFGDETSNIFIMRKRSSGSQTGIDLRLTAYQTNALFTGPWFGS